MCTRDTSETLFVNVETVQHDLGVSKSKAYLVIKDLNAALKRQYPDALIVAGRVNRIWYEQACLLRSAEYAD